VEQGRVEVEGRGKREDTRKDRENFAWSFGDISELEIF
jgi:hypothetical protein